MTQNKTYYRLPFIYGGDDHRLKEALLYEYYENENYWLKDELEQKYQIFNTSYEELVDKILETLNLDQTTYGFWACTSFDELLFHSQDLLSPEELLEEYIIFQENQELKLKEVIQLWDGEGVLLASNLPNSQLFEHNLRKMVRSAMLDRYNLELITE